MNLRSFFLLSVAVIVFPAVVRSQGFEAFMKSYYTGKYADCARFGTPLLGFTRHPDILTKLAECHSQSGGIDSALLYLDELVRGRWPVDLDAAPFSSLRNHPRRRHLDSLARAFRLPDKSTTVVTLKDRLFVPEGIAADERSGDLYIGSLALNKIVVLRRGEVQDFAGTGEHGLSSVLGMKVHNGELWACSASDRDGSSAVFRFNLRTRALVKRYEPDTIPGPQFFNDITFDNEGNAYVTDSKGGTVWTIRRNSDSAEVFVAPPFVYPNGIAFAPRASSLYVADYRGLWRVALPSGEISRVDPAGEFLQAIDGLLFNGEEFFAVQTAGGSSRIAAFTLDPGGNRVARLRLIQVHQKSFETPTTAAFLNGRLYFLPNTFVTKFAGGELTDPAAVRAAEVRWVDVRR